MFKPPRDARPLTPGEVALARTIFGDAIDYAATRISRTKWAFFQPRDRVMAPSGCIHFHPQSNIWHDDFSTAHVTIQVLFVHEMTHILQHQRGVYLPLARHPWCRYEYALKPGQPFSRYGLEQQAEIVRHVFMLRRGYAVAGAPPLEQYETLLPFTRSSIA